MRLVGLLAWLMLVMAGAPAVGQESTTTTISVATTSVSVDSTVPSTTVPGFAPASAPEGAGPDHPTRATVESVLVLLKPGSQMAEVATDARPVFDRWIEVPVPPGKTVDEWLSHLSGLPPVAEVRRNQRYTFAGVTINDPYYSSQWHLARIGVTSSLLSAGAGEGITVAVIDSGTDRGPDGFCNPFVAEYDAVYGGNGPGAAADDDGHGTFVAGVVAQCTGNGIGVAGVAPLATIMPIRVFDSYGGSTTASLTRGIEWARLHGADVINMSLGCACYDPLVEQAVNRALTAGMAVVAASGNDGGAVSFPASIPGVIAVGATSTSDGRATFSNYGYGLDLVAPGVDIVQETFGGSGWQYYYLDGTSFSSPQVAGAVALLMGRGLTADDAYRSLRCAAVSPTSGWSGDKGFGRLSVTDWCARVVGVDGGGRWLGHNIEDQTLLSQQGFYYGNPGDRPFLGDWNCDGIDTPGLYRQSDGYVYLRNTNSQGIADIKFFFGNPGDVPVAGDFDGDECDTVSIYRPSEGRFYIINKLGSNDGGLGAAEYDFYFGDVGDTPFVGDFDGDGIDTVGLHRASTGFVYFRNSNTTGVGEYQFYWGIPGDQVFAADWDRDGDDTVGLYRPSSSTLYFRNSNTPGNAEWSVFTASAVFAVAGQG